MDHSLGFGLLILGIFCSSLQSHDLTAQRRFWRDDQYLGTVDLNFRAAGSGADKVPFHKPVLLQFDQGTDFNDVDAVAP